MDQKYGFFKLLSQNADITKTQIKSRIKPIPESKTSSTAIRGNLTYYGNDNVRGMESLQTSRTTTIIRATMNDE